MKLTQFWRNGRPALGLWTDQGILDVAAEATRKGLHCTGHDGRGPSSGRPGS